MKNFAIFSLVLGVLLMVAAPVLATNQETKVKLCHKTSSESNPWVVQSVNANEVQSHLDNGDFLYKGSASVHSQEAKDWCDNNQPGDICSNLDGKQTELPKELENNDGVCTEVKETPVATPSSNIATISALPNTGSNVWLLELVGVGLTSFGWAVKRTLKGN